MKKSLIELQQDEISNIFGGKKYDAEESFLSSLAYPIICALGVGGAFLYQLAMKKYSQGSLSGHRKP